MCRAAVDDIGIGRESRVSMHETGGLMESNGYPNAMTDDELYDLATKVWEAKTPIQRASLDSGDWETGFFDCARAMRPDPRAGRYGETVEVDLDTITPEPKLTDE
jgi:hypothetical protein